MMNTIVNEKLVSFKELEKKIYSYVCELAREITQQMLESYDEELAKSRDKKVYRGKGKRKTSIKTIYGEVEYSRNVYRTETEDGQVAHIFLLDQAMHMDKIGLISTNLAEKIALTVTESPYRVTAEQISSTCGQSISAGGVWNMMQRLGERIDEEKEKQNRSTLVNKTMLAGMEKSNDFHAKREACIRKKYAADEIGQRILNGDGGSWIKEPYDPDTIFQLDRYHIYQEILRKISNKDAQKEIRRLFDEEKMDEMLEYIQIYATSVASQDENDKSSKKAMELYQYLNNKDGLLPYDKRGINIPAPEKGILYKGMGIQETQNCTVITLRMKHRRMRWSVNGANNLAKALYRKENRELVETIDRYTDGLVFTMQMQEIIETLSAAKAPKKMEKEIHTQTDSIIICHCLKQCRRYQEKHLKEHLVIRTKILSGALLGKQKRRKYYSRKTMRKLPTFT